MTNQLVYRYEEWFDLIKNMHTFVHNPDHVNKRFHNILDACYQPGLNDVEQVQYLRAMLSEEDKLDIGRAYYEDGYLDGVDEQRQKTIAGIKALLANGVQDTIICKSFSLSSQELEEIKGIS